MSLITSTPSTVRDYVDGLLPDAAIWIDGSGRTASTGTTFPVVDPATGDEITNVSDGTVLDASAAVDSAARAAASWAALAPRIRSQMLRTAFELMIADTENLANLISWENGKSLVDSRGEVAYAAEFFRWFSEEMVRTDGGFGVSPAGGTRTIVTHKPVGVAALITPWNFPAAMATRKIAPALAAGCTVVLKPAAETPLTALAIARILGQAGIPAGVVNVLPSTNAAEVVSTWLDDPRVRAISFTGSTGVGRALLRQAADRVVNTSMELGGNAPFVVAEDADIDAAVAGAMIAKMRNGGQACTAANRLYVHSTVLAEFSEKFGTAVAALTVGPAFAPETAIGPLISQKALDTVTALVDAAVLDGATIAYRADAPAGTGGFFYPPTVLTGVSADSPLLQAEIFGPVAPIVSWDTDDEVVELINSTEFGLAAYIYSGDLKRAMKLAEATDAGMVGINRGIVSDPAAPFGGFKQSGIGREGARDGLHEFQETQYFSIDWS